MQITFAKSFNVLKLWKIYSRAVPLQQTNNIVWFLAHLFDFSPSVVHLTLFPLFFITQNSNTHIKSKNQNTKRRTETKNIPYFWIKKSQDANSMKRTSFMSKVAAALASHILAFNFVVA